MTLSDTQSLILSAASQRADRTALPLPKSLKGGAADKVITSLLRKDFLAAVDAAKGQPIWRTPAHGRGTTLVITKAGLAAIGLEDEAPAPAKTKRAAKTTPKAPPKANADAPVQREGTKQAQMIEMLRRKGGATIAEIAEATGWQKHTVRGAMAGALKKRLGLDIEATAEERGRVYRIV